MHISSIRFMRGYAIIVLTLHDHDYQVNENHPGQATSSGRIAQNAVSKTLKTPYFASVNDIHS
jgi:hypothetical protein